MKKFLLWLLMVLLGIAALLGGTVWYFYSGAQIEVLPQITANGQAIEASGCDYQVPVLGGVLFKQDARAIDRQPVLIETEERHIPITPDAAAIETTVEIIKENQTVFEGSLGEYEVFRFPANGTYGYKVVQKFAPAAENERPRAYGSASYEFQVRVSVELSVTSTPSTAKQGDIVMVRVANNLDNTQPSAVLSDGTRLNFIQVNGDYTAYLPISYIQETGKYTIAVTLNGQTYELPLTVEYLTYSKINVADASQLPDAAGDSSPASTEQFRSAIWPLYQQMSAEKLWDGVFIAPLPGVNVSFGYGTGSMLPGASTSVRHGGADYTAPDATEGSATNAAAVVAPNAGKVVFAGELGLTGKTIVLEHGGGLKSFLFHLSSVDVSTGSAVTKGQQIGTLAPKATLHYEVRIGNKTVDPVRLMKGDSALYR